MERGVRPDPHRERLALNCHRASSSAVAGRRDPSIATVRLPGLAVKLEVKNEKARILSESGPLASKEDATTSRPLPGAPDPRRHESIEVGRRARTAAAHAEDRSAGCCRHGRTRLRTWAACSGSRADGGS